MFKRKDVQIILWLTFITVAAWIGFHIYHVSVTSTISEEIEKQIAPIDPNFDINTINKLKEREQVEPMYQYRETVEEPTASPEAEQLITPTEILSPQVTDTP